MHSIQNNILTDNKPFILLETGLCDKENSRSLQFKDPIDVITFSSGDDIDTFFGKIEGYLKHSFWVAGYFSYEFGFFLDDVFRNIRTKKREPLAWVAICKKPVITKSTVRLCTKDAPSHSIDIKKIGISTEQYHNAISRIKRYIEKGLTYQVNFTFGIDFTFTGGVLALYERLRMSQPTPYMALIRTGKEDILSFSPELFFRIKDGRITVRPMKGTAPRGDSVEKDAEFASWLSSAPKTRAENIMIVDLLRNDLGRIAEHIDVPKLFSIEKHGTLSQMTSTVTAKLRSGITTKEIFTSLFPSGSVTGAPKISTMHLIHKLENRRRGIYTGAIGYISPKKDACFNVAIRTMTIQNGRGSMGIGGGIVYDSDPGDEYKEALLKSDFAFKTLATFSLIETILWDHRIGYHLLPLHLKRLYDSAKFFKFHMDMKSIRRSLERFAATMKKGRYRVRLTIDRVGCVTIEKTRLNPIHLPVKIGIARGRTDPHDTFLYHKTTRREIYVKAHKECVKNGLFDMIFFNTRNELTEGAITNIFLLKNGILYTPPVRCGLLDGVLRRHLISKGIIKEKILRSKDLNTADRIFVGNSVRGLLPAKIV